jgi:murein DD-endopeptidase MepM/ murein hydrolase activator NlpD
MHLLPLLLTGCTFKGGDRVVYLKEGEIMVRKGETLSSVAARTGASIKALAEINHLRPPYSLKNIDKLTLPPADGSGQGEWQAVPPVNTPAGPRLINEKDEAEWTNMDDVGPSSIKKQDRQAIVASAQDTDAPVDQNDDDDALEDMVTTRNKAKPTKPADLDADDEKEDEPAPKAKKNPAVRKQSFSRPVSGRMNPNKQGGVSFAAATGTPVYAPADGTVLVSGKMTGDPSKVMVMIQHEDGLTSCFKRMAQAEVRKNQTIKQGDCLGVCEGPTMIFELRKDRKMQNIYQCTQTKHW